MKPGLAKQFFVN